MEQNTIIGKKNIQSFQLRLAFKVEKSRKLPLFALNSTRSWAISQEMKVEPGQLR
jgi:hypothetical protein